jgi:hypothetical protein
VLLKSFQGFETVVRFLNLKSVNTQEVLEQVESKDCVQWKVDTVFSYSICHSVPLLEKWSDAAYLIEKKRTIPYLFYERFDVIKAARIMITVFWNVMPRTLVPTYQII